MKETEVKNKKGAAKKTSRKDEPVIIPLEFEEALEVLLKTKPIDNKKIEEKRKSNGKGL
jgi:NTP pyrophosphatase (non-canonical NTP hydrolase)